MRIVYILYCHQRSKYLQEYQDIQFTSDFMWAIKFIEEEKAISVAKQLQGAFQIIKIYK